MQNLVSDLAGKVSTTSTTTSPTAWMIPVADSGGTLNEWVAKSVRAFHYEGLPTSLRVWNDAPNWHSVLSFNTGAEAGSIMAQSTVTVRGIYDNVVHARLLLDTGQIMVQYTSTLMANGYVTLSPVGRISYGAGGHIVTLEVACEIDFCYVQGNDEVAGGSAVLIATEYTN